jgi:hypothetical protein
VTERVVLAEGSDSGRPYSHLLPIVEAEESWGNRARDTFREDKTGWHMTMERPLHIDRLSDTFVFPPNVTLGRGDDGGTSVADVDRGYAWCWIEGGKPGPVSPRPSLLSRILGR